MGTIVGHDAYLAELEPQRVSLLSGIPGFRHETVWWDVMHIVHLGIAADLVGSALVELSLSGSYGVGDLDERLKRAFLKFQSWCRCNGVPNSCEPFSRASLAYRSSKQYPQLQAKAYNTKVVLFFTAAECLAAAVGAGSYEQQRATAVWGLASRLHLMGTADIIMTATEAEAACRAGHSYLVCYSNLARLCLHQRRCAYKVRPKMHYFQHMLLEMRATRINPRAVYCMHDEDFMGKISKIAAKVHRSTVAKMTLFRYRLLLCQRWGLR